MKWILKISLPGYLWSAMPFWKVLCIWPVRTFGWTPTNSGQLDYPRILSISETKNELNWNWLDLAFSRKTYLVSCGNFQEIKIDFRESGVIYEGCSVALPNCSGIECFLGNICNYNNSGRSLLMQHKLKFAPKDTITLHFSLISIF